MRRALALTWVAVVVLPAVAFAGTAAVAFAGTAVAPEATSTAGVARFVKHADSGYDAVTRDPPPRVQAEIRRSFWRATVFTPYWHERSRWYADGWVYKNLYAIYRGDAGGRSALIARDERGRPLSIPFGCSGGTCPQWAGDVTNPAFRRLWIDGARAELARGRYRGIFVDDVNLDRRISNGYGRPVPPVHHRTGKPMSEREWADAVADFTEEIRAALPEVELVHNAIWYAGGPRGRANPAVRRAWAAADWVFLERGVNDAGLTGGDGPFGLRAFLATIDDIHRAGNSIVLDAAGSRTGAEYALAAYFLVNAEGDAISAEARSGRTAGLAEGDGLGVPRAPRRTWEGLLRRDFSRGLVLVNEPGAPRRTVELGGRWRTLSGAWTTRVSLAPSSGAVLRR